MKWLPFEFALALRYLRPKRTSVSFITLISVVGVMLGVAVLIIVTSVFSGFHLQLKKSFFQFSADLTVRPLGGPIVEYEALSDRIAKIPGVTGVSPIIGGKVMMETDPEIGAPAFDAPVLLGVDPERIKTVSQVPDNLEAGEFNLRNNRLVIGYNFARLDGEFRLQVGDRVLIHSPKSIQEMRESQQADEELGIFPDEYIVAGVFDAGQKDLNDFIFCSIYNAQDLYGLEEGAAMLWVETTDPLELDPQQVALEKLLGEGYRVGTWKDLNPVLLAQVLKYLPGKRASAGRKNDQPIPDVFYCGGGGVWYCEFADYFWRTKNQRNRPAQSVGRQQRASEFCVSHSKCRRGRVGYGYGHCDGIVGAEIPQPVFGVPAWARCGVVPRKTLWLPRTARSSGAG
ncbi:ABC transporter permease [Verrucomicrobia bacterium]|nr:ABC transporter permease [Verrucomicrobiota bacterium]